MKVLYTRRPPAGCELWPVVCRGFAADMWALGVAVALDCDCCDPALGSPILAARGALCAALGHPAFFGEDGASSSGPVPVVCRVCRFWPTPRMQLYARIRRGSFTFPDCLGEGLGARGWIRPHEKSRLVVESRSQGFL